MVVVDGALNPEAIPDEIAFLHFFRFFARNPRAVSRAADDLRRTSYLRLFFTTTCGATGTGGSLFERI